MFGTWSLAAATLFGLGVVLYVMATGEFPFGTSQRIAAVKRRLWRDPYPPRAWKPDCPPWLQEASLAVIHDFRRVAHVSELTSLLHN